MMELTRNDPIEETALVSLLRRAQQSGDPDAFDGIYTLYADRIYRFLLAHVKDEQFAEDLTSRVFLRLLERIDQYDVAEDDNASIFSAWLYRIARNIMYDAYRTAQRVNTVPIETAATQSSRKRVITEVEKRFDVETIMERLQTLTPEQRDVVILRFLEELSIAETAAVMDRTEGAVKALQHRALDNLRQYFGAED